MDDLDELRASLDASRSQLKSAQRVIRTTLQFLTDLEDRLDKLAPSTPIAQPGRHSNGHSTADAAFVFTARR